jgi:hypothetical protein
VKNFVDLNDVGLSLRQVFEVGTLQVVQKIDAVVTADLPALYSSCDRFSTTKVDKGLASSEPPK